MKTRSKLDGLWLLLALLCSGTTAALEPLTQAQAQRELKILERGLQALHPGLYRYQNEAELSAEFERAREAVAEGASPEQMYLLATRIAASVRCGHTWTNPLNQRADLAAALDGQPTLPVRVRLLGQRLLVIASADPEVNRFDEILSINGRSVAALVQAWMPYLRADGSSDGKRLIQLGSEDGGMLDRLLPLLQPPQDGRYRLQLRTASGPVRALSVAGVPAAQRDAALKAAGYSEPGEEWTFEVRGEVAVLTLQTFAFWRGGFDWKAFLDASFDSLHARGIGHLVIDLRRNEGGDSAIGRNLLARLIDAPYSPPVGRVESAYERAPYELARFMDTWDFSFFDRTGAVERGEGRNWLLKLQPDPEQVMPLAPRFAGRVSALIGPQMSSAGYLLARDLKATGAARLIGEATGGNQRGLNGGQLAWLTLPHSGVAVDIPLLATVYPGAPDAGITPDFEVITTPEDVIAGVDPVLQRALQSD